jgi:outer membrane protein OmpA-like peptidoglycan-associated protein
MNMSFFGKDLEERKEIIIALLVILFFFGLTYKMDWFSAETQPVELTTAHLLPNEELADHPTYYQASASNNIDIPTSRNSQQLPQVEMTEITLQDNIVATATISKDLDGDGVLDDQDRCPTIFGSPENNGCLVEVNKISSTNTPALDSPEPVITSDVDGDGVLDDQDHCPNISGSPENNGCLVEIDKVNTNDTSDPCATLSEADCAKTKIPPTAVAQESIDTSKSEPTLPLDSDKDGIPDDQDNCPNIAGVAENKGCLAVKEVVIETSTQRASQADDLKAPPAEVKVTEAERKIIDNAISSVAFITGSSKLTQYSQGLLDKVATVLVKNSSYNLLIRGHTDSSGDEALNFTLSQDRAKSTFSYLALQGVSKNRMSHSGFGQRRPIASNETKKGRLKNRRVELKLYSAN